MPYFEIINQAMPSHLLLCLHHHGSSRFGLGAHLRDPWKEPGRAVFRPPEFPCPLFVLVRQSYAQERLRPNKLHFVKGEAGYDMENVAPTRLPLPGVSFQNLSRKRLLGVVRCSLPQPRVKTTEKIHNAARTLLLSFGVGVFFILQFPAWATPKTSVAGSPIAQAVGSIQMSEILTSGWAGLLAGGLHALTGPDHLAALAPLCIGRAKLESALIGALWGCGHDAGQVIFGLAFLLLKGRLHIELVRTWASRVVGVTLLAIGAVGLKEAQEVPVSILAEGGASNTYPGEAVGSRKNTQRLRTFATGLVYGLQPDALIMILPALALPSRLAGAAYLGMFLLGTVVAMGSYTAFIGSCGNALQKRLPWITRRLAIGSSLIAIAFGLGVLVGELFGLNIF